MTCHVRQDSSGQSWRVPRESSFSLQDKQLVALREVLSCRSGVSSCRRLDHGHCGFKLLRRAGDSSEPGTPPSRGLLRAGDSSEPGTPPSRGLLRAGDSSEPGTPPSRGLLRAGDSSEPGTPPSRGLLRAGDSPGGLLTTRRSLTTTARLDPRWPRSSAWAPAAPTPRVRRLERKRRRPPRPRRPRPAAARRPSRPQPSRLAYAWGRWAPRIGGRGGRRSPCPHPPTLASKSPLADLDGSGDQRRRHVSGDYASGRPGGSQLSEDHVRTIALRAARRALDVAPRRAGPRTWAGAVSLAFQLDDPPRTPHDDAGDVDQLASQTPASHGSQPFCAGRRPPGRAAALRVQVDPRRRRCGGRGLHEWDRGFRAAL